MIDRRTALPQIASAVAGPAPAGAISFVPQPGSPAAAERLPDRWLCDETSGRFWPVDDVFTWIDRNADGDALRHARTGLAKTADPIRRLRLVLRRCHLHYVEVIPPGAEGPPATAGSDRVTVRVHHWRRAHGDLRPLFKALGLARPETTVQLCDRRRETVKTIGGEEFLYGQPLPVSRPLAAGEPHPVAPPLDVLVERWESRHVPAARDWSPATSAPWLPRWPQADGPGLPWGALEIAWQIVTPLVCPNCDGPTILAGFGHRRTSFLGFSPRCEFACPGCRRLHVAPLGDLLARVTAAAAAAHPVSPPGSA